jgi:hypothetical protein
VTPVTDPRAALAVLSQLSYNRKERIGVDQPRRTESII